MISQQEPEAEWALLLYMAADNDLHDEAEKTIKQLQALPRFATVPVIVQVDKRDGTFQYVLRPSREAEVRKIEKVNTGDPTYLTAFIDWARSVAPSKKVALVIWNHGGGTLGIDKGAGGDYLTNAEFEEALADVEGQPCLDIVACDACLTGTLELANQLSSRAGYYIAPETNTPIQGWPYMEIIKNLQQAPALDAELVAQLIVDSFGRSTRSATPASAQTTVLGAWRLKAIPALRDAVDRLGAALNAAPGGPATVIPTAVRDQMIRMEDPDYVDLGSFLDRLEECPAIAEGDIARCREAFHAARVDIRPDRGLSGLSILFPDIPRPRPTPDSPPGLFEPGRVDNLLEAGLKGANSWKGFLINRLRGGTTDPAGATTG